MRCHRYRDAIQSSPALARYLTSGLLGWLIVSASVDMVSAQTSAGTAETGRYVVVGAIVDEHHDSVGGASVVAIEQTTHIVRRGDTTELGIYMLQSMSPGTYTVRLSKPGFPVITTSMTIERGSFVSTVDFTMPRHKPTKKEHAREQSANTKIAAMLNQLESQLSDNSQLVALVSTFQPIVRYARLLHVVVTKSNEADVYSLPPMSEVLAQRLNDEQLNALGTELTPLVSAIQRIHRDVIAAIHMEPTEQPLQTPHRPAFSIKVYNDSKPNAVADDSDGILQVRLSVPLLIGLLYAAMDSANSAYLTEPNRPVHALYVAQHAMPSRLSPSELRDDTKKRAQAEACGELIYYYGDVRDESIALAKSLLFVIGHESYHEWFDHHRNTSESEALADAYGVLTSSSVLGEQFMRPLADLITSTDKISLSEQADAPFEDRPFGSYGYDGMIAAYQRAGLVEGNSIHPPLAERKILLDAAFAKDVDSAKQFLLRTIGKDKLQKYLNQMMMQKFAENQAFMANILAGGK